MNTIIPVLVKEKSVWIQKLQYYAFEALDYYTSLFGFYPYESLAIEAGSSDCGGGYPIDKGVIAIHRKPFIARQVSTSWKWIVAHEIGHMYWGYYVLDDHPRKGSYLGWLTKGLGLYFDSLFIKAKKFNFNVHQQAVSRYMQLEKDGKETSFTLSPSQIALLPYDYNWIVDHGKAFYIINSIAEKVGEKQFIQVGKHILREYVGKKLQLEDVLRQVKTHTGISISIDI